MLCDGKGSLCTWTPQQGYPHLLTSDINLPLIYVATGWFRSAAQSLFVASCHGVTHWFSLCRLSQKVIHGTK